MNKQVKQLKEFNKTYGVKTTLGESWKLRYKLLFEELEEYRVACEKDDEVEKADAIGDMLYLLIGTAIEHGIEDKIANIFSEIHRSNMSKLEDGVVLRREDGKILKGKYSPTATLYI